MLHPSLRLDHLFNHFIRLGENSIIFPRLASHVPLNGADNLAVLDGLERVEEWVREAVRVSDIHLLCSVRQRQQPRLLHVAGPRKGRPN